METRMWSSSVEASTGPARLSILTASVSAGSSWWNGGISAPGHGSRDRSAHGTHHEPNPDWRWRASRSSATPPHRGGDCGFDAALRRVVGRRRGGHAPTCHAAEDRHRTPPRLEGRALAASRRHESGRHRRRGLRASSGFARSNATTFAFAEAARRLGATIETGCERCASSPRAAAWRGWRRAAGGSPARGGAVPGAWADGSWIRSASTSPRALPHTGLDLPLARRVHAPPPRDRRDSPRLVASRGAISTLIAVELGSDHVDPDKYNEGVDGATWRLPRESDRRFPAFARSRCAVAGGHDHDSADGRPIIDQVPTCRALGHAGDSGTSFKTSPAIGRCLPNGSSGQARDPDLSRFRSTRFAEGKPWVGRTGYGIDRSRFPASRPLRLLLLGVFAARQKIPAPWERCGPIARRSEERLGVGSALRL